MENTVEKKDFPFYVVMNSVLALLVLGGSIYFSLGSSKFQELMVIICTAFFGLQIIYLVSAKGAAEKAHAGAMSEGKIPKENAEVELFGWYHLIIPFIVVILLIIVRVLPEKYQLWALLLFCFITGLSLIIHGLLFFNKMRDLGLNDQIVKRRSDFIQVSIGAGILFLGLLNCSIQTLF